MTFHESEFPEILKKIKAKNPVLILKLFEEATRIYSRIPIYPGLVAQSLDTILKPRLTKNIRKGDWIAFRYNSQYYGGKIKKTGKNKIIFSNLFQFSSGKNKTMNIKKIRDIFSVNEDLFRSKWKSVMRRKRSPSGMKS